MQAFPVGHLRKQGIHRSQVDLLRKRVERQLQAEAIRQRHLLLDGLRRVQLTVAHLAFEIVRHEFRHQVPAIGGGIHPHILRRQFQGALQHAFQRLVASLADIKRQVIAEDHEPERRIADVIDDFRQIHQIILVHLDHPQPALLVSIQQRLDQRRLARAPGAPKQSVIGRLTGEKTLGIAGQGLLRPADAGEILPLHRIEPANGSQTGAVTAPDRRRGGLPVYGYSSGHTPLSYSVPCQPVKH